MFEFTFNPQKEPTYSALKDAAEAVRIAGMQVEFEAINKAVKLIESKELEFGGRTKALAYLRHIGLIEGVRVMDWCGKTGVIPAEDELKPLAYRYTLGFKNEAGEMVILSNGVYDARIIS